MAERNVQPGRPWPLGATPDEDGLNVAVFSAHASRIDLCLFDPSAQVETGRVELPACTDQVFHGHLPGLGAGQVYGLRAHGAWAPEHGQRFNPAKLLLDPYARLLRGGFRWAGPNLVDPVDPLIFDPRDSAPFVPKAVVVTSSPALPGGERPATPWAETVLYEASVRGMTRLHPAVPGASRGTFAGLAHPAVLDHLVGLGITAVELLPVAAFIDELRLVGMGLANYWGYNPVALMAPEPRYAGLDPLAEFRGLVAALHKAGIEVILDVVLNHTAETDELGPTLSWRGLDNASYYRLDPDNPALYRNDAGCGNTLNLGHPRVMQMALDALRHWAALGVDGFRFDLGTTLGRDRRGDFTPDSGFLQALNQDPVLGRLKLIAEPWDIGPHGYQAGAFPPPFAEWNDRFRDGVRAFWRGEEAVLPDLAARLLGSAERFEHNGRSTCASINYVAAHDGFTTRDLVTYAGKHNEANGEHNRDGHGDERGANYGVEGETLDPGIQALRLRQRRNLLATVLLAQGTPMLLMGDERGRTQGGNNNAYCQDNETSWMAWEEEPEAIGFQAFLARVIALRRAHPLLRQSRFLHGRETPSGGKDATWLQPEGGEMRAPAWEDGRRRCLGLMLEDATERLLLIVNADPAPVAFSLPDVGTVWDELLDTAGELVPDGRHAPGSAPSVAGRSLRLLVAG